MTTILKDQKKRYTYRDYANLDEGAPYQLIGGDLIMTTAPSTYHQISKNEAAISKLLDGFKIDLKNLF